MSLSTFHFHTNKNKLKRIHTSDLMNILKQDTRSDDFIEMEIPYETT